MAPMDTPVSAFAASRSRAARRRGSRVVVHGSDVARATGQEWSVSDPEAADLHATADGWGAALHSEGVCADAVEVGPDASATDRLLARLGRDPGWRPSVG